MISLTEKYILSVGMLILGIRKVISATKNIIWANEKVMSTSHYKLISLGDKWPWPGQWESDIVN